MRISACRYWWALGIVALVITLSATAFAWMTSVGIFSSFAGGVLVGGTAVAGVAGIYWIVDFVSGSRGARFGLAGEQATASLFESRSMRMAGWSVVHGVPFAGRGDIDHIAFGPAGVLAIETKWTSGAWAARDGTLRGPIDDPFDQVSGGADRLERFLISRGAPVPVTPVLVVWGRGCSIELAHGWVDHVLVLSGPEVAHLPELLDARVGHDVVQARVDRARQSILDYLANNPETRTPDRRIARLLARVRVS